MAKPKGVKVHRADGQILQAELVHDGIAEDGCDHWVIASPQVDLDAGDQITCEELPARTSLGTFSIL